MRNWRNYKDKARNPEASKAVYGLNALSMLSLEAMTIRKQRLTLVRNTQK